MVSRAISSGESPTEAKVGIKDTIDFLGYDVEREIRRHIDKLVDGAESSTGFRNKITTSFDCVRSLFTVDAPYEI